MQTSCANICILKIEKKNEIKGDWTTCYIAGWWQNVEFNSYVMCSGTCVTVYACWSGICTLTKWIWFEKNLISLVSKKVSCHPLGEQSDDRNRGHYCVTPTVFSYPCIWFPVWMWQDFLLFWSIRWQICMQDAYGAM